jgi:hypothetical protein
MPWYTDQPLTWEQFRANEHMFLFNESSARKLFDVVGLKVISLEKGMFPGDMFIVGAIKP